MPQYKLWNPDNFCFYVAIPIGWLIKPSFVPSYFGFVLWSPGDDDYGDNGDDNGDGEDDGEDDDGDEDDGDDDDDDNGDGDDGGDPDDDEDPNLLSMAACPWIITTEWVLSIWKWI